MASTPTSRTPRSSLRRKSTGVVQCPKSEAKSIKRGSATSTGPSMTWNDIQEDNPKLKSFQEAFEANIFNLAGQSLLEGSIGKLNSAETRPKSLSSLVPDSDVDKSDLESSLKERKVTSSLVIEEEYSEDFPSLGANVSKRKRLNSLSLRPRKKSISISKTVQESNEDSVPAVQEDLLSAPTEEKPVESLELVLESEPPQKELEPLMLSVREEKEGEANEIELHPVHAAEDLEMTPSRCSTEEHQFTDSYIVKLRENTDDEGDVSTKSSPSDHKGRDETESQISASTQNTRLLELPYTPMSNRIADVLDSTPPVQMSSEPVQSKSSEVDAKPEDTVPVCEVTTPVVSCFEATAQKTVSKVYKFFIGGALSTVVREYKIKTYLKSHPQHAWAFGY